MPTMRSARIALVAFAALGVVHLAPTAYASDVSQDKMPSSYGALMKMKPLDVMHMMDTDGKGDVTREEFMKFQEKMFERMDRDGDGKLNAREFDGGG